MDEDKNARFCGHACILFIRHLWLKISKQCYAHHLSLAYAVDRVIHNGDEGVEEDDDSEDKVEGEQSHSNVSRIGRVCPAAKLFDCAWFKNIPEQKFENRIQTIELNYLK